jgi:predicted transcriptional regulator
MEQEIKERIKSIISHYSLTDQEYTDKLESNAAVTRHILEGRNRPNMEYLQKIITAFPEINERWLLVGEGTMTKE